MPGDYDIEYASPWAGANYFPVGKPGTNLQRFEKSTWAELERLCQEVPEAGIHFQRTRVYGRKKDEGTATGQWFEELTKEDAWFKGVVPDVCRISSSNICPIMFTRLWRDKYLN
jgi:D-amino-acid oxidase